MAIPEKRKRKDFYGSESRAALAREDATHDRGANVGKGLPRKRPAGDVRGRVPGTNGSFPAHGVGAERGPKPPAILALYDDIVEAELPTAIFGQYPKRFIAKLLPWMNCARHEIVHVCSGALRAGEGIRVDVRADARPDIIADGRQLPFADGSVAAVMIDPPYTRQYARDLYGVEYPLPSHLLREAARVVRPCGRIAFVHYLVPMPPTGCTLVKVFGMSTGFGYPMRAVTLFQREAPRLFA